MENQNDLSLPAEFCSRMRGLLTEEEWQAYVASLERKRLFSLRLNPLKGERDHCGRLLEEAASGDLRDISGELRANAGELQDVSGELRAASGDLPAPTNEGLLRPVPWEPDGLYYPEQFRPGRLPWHEAGMYYIQEASAMVPAMLCGAQPGERVLDLCAAPGGKASKIAADLRGEGLLVANEIHPERAKVLSSNLERLGVRNALVTNASPQELASRFPLFFDRIVVDAPCSGEGMFRKEEEALRHWSPDNVRMCAERQLDILEEAASMLRFGGTMVYSTCTFSSEENEGVLDRFLDAHPEFSIVRIQDLPGIDAGGWGFAPGRPDWIGAAQGEAAPETGLTGDTDSTAGTLSSGCAPREELAGAVRLWPHRLEGEGHFAALLKKAEKKTAPGSGRRAEPPGPGEEDLREEDCRKEDRREEDRRDLRDREAGAFFRSAEKSIRSGKRKKETALLSSPKGTKGGKKGRRKDAGQEPGNAQMLDLWKDFREESLAGPFGPEAFAPEYLFRFGDTLCALPVPAGILPLAGLRVMRAGLELGTVTKGRFVPAHALGMALKKEEVRRSVDLSGRSGAAYAWLRGEAVPLPEDLNSAKGWVLVCIDGCAAGWGKAAGDLIKNHYPRGLRRGSSYRPA